MRLRLLVLLLLCSVSASALTVVVKRDVEVQLRRVDAEGAVRRVALQAGANDVGVTAGMWEIAAVSGDVWAAPVYATAAESVTLALWPRAEITGTIAKGPASGDLSVHFASEAVSGVSVCELKERKYRCAVPAETLDLRFAVPGFANEFLWGVKTPAALHDIELTPGSSLSGFVEGGAAEVVAQSGAKKFKATSGAKGFFQIKGLAPGEYTVRATAKDLLSEIRRVQIIGHTNASLKDPLILAKPATLTVRLMPQLDPRNQPWNIELSRRREDERLASDMVSSSHASPDGEWTARGLTPGDYEVTVAQQDGSQWKSEPVAVTSGDVTLNVLVTGERVAGTISLGETPLAATLRFGGERGQAVVASEDGRFSGVIAPPGDEAIFIDITAEDAELHRTLKLKGRVDAEGVRWFDIRLAATSVSGVVRNEDGSPAASAIVALTAEDETIEQTFAREDGTFAFAAIEPGIYRLSAQAVLERSDVLEVKVRDETEDSYVLVLRPGVTVLGRVAMGTVPVTGATVYGVPRNVQMQFGGRVRSDLAGKFALQLPPGTETYDIAVIPRGFYVSIGRMQVTQDRVVRAEIGQDGGALTVDAPADQYVRLLHAGAELSMELLARESEGTVERTKERLKLGIANLEPGMYSVCGAKECVAAYVPRWGVAEVSLR